MSSIVSQESGFSREVWLVTGGAGYIGSHVVRGLLSAGSSVVVMDNLRTGLLARLPADAAVEVGDCSDSVNVDRIIREFGVTGVIHLAAFKHARESELRPLDYWRNNVGALLGVLEALANWPDIPLVFSSSCSVFGSGGPVSESSNFHPMSPYARTKVACETAIRDFAAASNLNFIILRYFNVIGCDSFPHSQDSSSECLVPRTIARIEMGVPPEVFGDSYETADGFSERDYLDVRDLAAAHVLAASRLAKSSQMSRREAINLGRGAPTSTMKIVRGLLEMLGSHLEPDIRAANSADPASVWADPRKASDLLNWSASIPVEVSLRDHITAATNRFS